MHDGKKCKHKESGCLEHVELGLTDTVLLHVLDFIVSSTTSARIIRYVSNSRSGAPTPQVLHDNEQSEPDVHP